MKFWLRLSLLFLALPLYWGCGGGGGGGQASNKALVQITTAPVAGEIFLYDFATGSLVGSGTGSYSGQHQIGNTYEVRFGAVEGYAEPAPEDFTLSSSGFTKTYYYEEVPGPPT